MERILPIGGNKWEALALEHNACFPEKNRTELSLWRQFQKLYKKPAPTGDPNIPPQVFEAKRLQILVEQRADATGMEERGDVGFAEDLPQEGAVANAGPGQAFAAVHNARPVINVGARVNNNNAAMADIMQLMMVRTEEERAERAARAEERERHNQQILAQQQQMNVILAGLLGRNDTSENKNNNNNN